MGVCLEFGLLPTHQLFNRHGRKKNAGMRVTMEFQIMPTVAKMKHVAKISKKCIGILRDD
jgi:hypothetical protein